MAVEGSTHKIVKSSELGTRCWLVARFIEGGRCPRVMRCKYPEKKTCKAVDTEIAYQKERLHKVAEQVRRKVFQLERNKVGVDEDCPSNNETLFDRLELERRLGK